MRLLPLVLALAACAPTQDPVEPTGETLYVLPSEEGELDDPSVLDTHRAFTTIQDAIDNATAGDVVVVPNGVYDEDVVMKDDVDVTGGGIGETFIDGTVTFTSHSSATTLSGVTVRNDGTAYTGVGVSVDGGTANLEEIAGTGWDKAVQIYQTSDVSVVRSVFTFNEYGFWSDESSTLLVANNIFRSNNTSGITNYTTDGQIIHNTLVGNAFGASSQIDFGGALQLGTGDTEVVYNNVMVSNYYGVNCQSCDNTFSHNLVWGNVTNYVNDATGTSSDVNDDPLFTNPNEFDYSLTVGSPAVNAGTTVYTVADDHVGTSRGDGQPDMGAFEYAVSSYDLLITEVMANAAAETTDEFVEIYNNGSVAVDLAGFLLTDGDQVDALQAHADSTGTTLDPGEYAVVLDPNYDNSGSGEYGVLSGVLLTTPDNTVGNGLTTSDRVTLYEPDATTIAASFSYPADPGDNRSLELYVYANGDVAGNWRPSACTPDTWSPGAADCFVATGDTAGLVLTEVLANATDESTGEYIELYNPTDQDIDAAGLIIEDEAGNQDTVAGFNGGSTLIPPKSHALILDNGYAFDYYLPNDVVLLDGGATLGNALNNVTTETVTLYKADGTTVIDTFSHNYDTSNGISVEKVDYTGGDVQSNWQLADASCMRGHTPGRLNGASGGICNQLFINEVMSNALDEDTGEYIEIFNPGPGAVDLSGLQISDGDEVDTLTAYDGGSTVLEQGFHALIVDAEYAGEYSLPQDLVMVTTTDTHLGNGLSVADPVTLWEGDYLIDAYVYPINAGNGTSVERVYQAGLFDSQDNWVASTCAGGASPGQVNCASGGAAPAVSTLALAVTEVMSNPVDEDTGEYVEIYNYGNSNIDLKGMVLWDGDALDTLFGFYDPDDTVLAPGEYAVVLDYEYAGEYTIPSGALLLTTDDTTVCSGVAQSDPIYLFESNGATFIDGFSWPKSIAEGNAWSKDDVLGGDAEANWLECAANPGEATPCN